jgi:hypothetical protein
VQEQKREQSALALATQLDELPVLPDFERSEQPKLERRRVGDAGVRHAPII